MIHSNSTGATHQIKYIEAFTIALELLVQVTLRQQISKNSWFWLSFVNVQEAGILQVLIEVDSPKLSKSKVNDKNDEICVNLTNFSTLKLH